MTDKNDILEIKEAILSSAVSVIVRHNPPSGDLTPSCEDLEIIEK